MKAQKAKRQTLIEKLEALEEPDDTIELHPAAIHHTAATITSITAMPGKEPIDGKCEAAQRGRATIYTVTVFPSPMSARGIHIEIVGRFAAFEEADDQRMKIREVRATPLSGAPMVAEEGF